MNDAPRGRVLVIAGSDSGAGAGIQADLKTVAALGGYATTCLTAVTAQNTLGVDAVHMLPADMVSAQIRAVAGDIGADVVKTGMLGTAEIVETAFSTLQEVDPEADIPLVVDPVMIAESGASLLDDDAVAAMREILVPEAFLVTPNAPEAARLTGVEIEDVDGQRAAAEKLLEMGASAALVKGAHIEGPQIVDLIAGPEGVRMYTRPRVRTRHTHGTGCTLASAIAAFLAQGRTLDDAVEAAGDYLHEAIKRAPGFGAGAGPVEHMWPLKSL
jgi:hydroxymethylpyrimidine/phosphomethylpyrimidine kinase